MRLSSQSSLVILQTVDTDDPILLDILSNQLNLPYKEQVNQYIYGHKGPVTTLDLRKIYSMPIQTLAERATKSRDIRVLKPLLDTKKVNVQALSGYIRGLDTLLLLQQYGYQIKQSDLVDAISYVYHDKDKAIDYILASLHEPLSISILNTLYIILPYNDMDYNLFVKLVTKTRPVQLETLPCSTLNKIKVLIELGFGLPDNVLASFTRVSQKDIFNYLLQLEYVPDINVLESSIWNNNIELTDFILHNYDIPLNENLLYVAIRAANTHLVRMLCPLIPNKSGDDYTIVAVRTGDLDMLKVLTELGESVGSRTLNEAIKNDNIEMVEWLLKFHPETVEFPDQLYAYAEGNDEIIDLLNRYIK